MREVADAAAMFRFAVPRADGGSSTDRTLPMLLGVRGGADQMPGLGTRRWTAS